MTDEGREDPSGSGGASPTEGELDRFRRLLVEQLGPTKNEWARWVVDSADRVYVERRRTPDSTAVQAYTAAVLSIMTPGEQPAMSNIVSAVIERMLQEGAIKEEDAVIGAMAELVPQDEARARARVEHPLSHAVMDVVGGRHISLNEDDLRRVLAEQGWVEVGASARGPRWSSRRAMVTIESRLDGDHVVTRAGDRVMSEARIGQGRPNTVDEINAALAEAVTTHRDGMALLYDEWRGEIVTSLVTLTRAHGVASLLDHLGMDDLGDEVKDTAARLRATRTMLDAAHQRLDQLGAPRDDDRDLPTAQSVAERIGWLVDHLLTCVADRGVLLSDVEVRAALGDMGLPTSPDDLTRRIRFELGQTSSRETIPSVGWFKSKYLEWMAMNEGHDAYGFGEWLDQQLADEGHGPTTRATTEPVPGQHFVTPPLSRHDFSFIARCSMLNGRPVMTVLGTRRGTARAFLRRAFEDGVGVALVVDPGPPIETGAVEERFTTVTGSVLRREPTTIERELAREIIAAIATEEYKAPGGMTLDMDLIALTISNVIVNVCDYTPGEQTVSALQEVGALCGTPMLAGEGIRAFVAVLKRYWGSNVAAPWMGDVAIDELAKRALKGETR